VLSLRIVTASAVFLTLAAGSASAQTATTATPGKPLQLFQIIQQKDDTAAVNPHHRARHVRRRVARTHVANQTIGAPSHAYMEARPAPEPEQTATTPTAATPAAATAAAPANIWPAPDVTSVGIEPFTLPSPAAPAAASNEPIAAANPNEMLTAAHHAVQVTPPNAAQVAAPDTAQVTPATAVDPTEIAAGEQHVTANMPGPNTPRPSETAATWPVQHAMAVTPEPENPNPVGSPAWIARVIAALVGAIATGALAWVLINPLPVRSYE